MSYYDFDEHFWSPQEVCCQTPVEISNAPPHKWWMFITAAITCASVIVLI